MRLAALGRISRRARAGAAIAGAAFLLVSSTVAFAEMEGPTNAEVLDYFGRIAFGTESGGSWDRIRKWDRPIRVLVEGRPTNEDIRQVAVLVGRLAAITGHDIEVFDPDNYERKANVSIAYVERQYFSLVLEHYDQAIYKDRPDLHRPIERDTILCMARPYPGKNSTIGYALILIPTDVDFGERTACVVEELGQSLGLPNDSKAAERSIFNDHSSQNDLTPHDRALLRLLYRPEIKPGMTKDEAMAVAARLLDTHPEIASGD